MHPILITPAEAGWNAEDNEGPTVAGWHCVDFGGWHGPFEGYPEALKFVAYCEREDRTEARHNRNLMAGSEKV